MRGAQWHVPAKAGSLIVFSFGMCEDVGFEVGGLSKLFVAAVKRADVRPVTSVNAHVRAQVKVQREALPTAFKRTLQRGRGEDKELG